MNNTSSHLDPDELFHLALSATENDNNESAIELLKRAQDLQPNNAKIIYMLGAVHAQIGLYDRAIEEIDKAVSIDPTIDAAHFQLGMLYITSGKVKEAEKAWAPLDKLGDQHPFYLFKSAFLHLVRDEFEKTIELLKRGIELNDFNQPLNRDMEKVLASTEDALSKQSSVKDIVQKVIHPLSGQPGNRRLSAYENADEQENR